MFFNDDNFLYLKIPKQMGSGLIKAIVQASISISHDQRSSPERLDMTQYLLLQFANEMGNTEKITEEESDILNSIFNKNEPVKDKDRL